MTRQKFYANEKRIEMFEAVGYRCEHCGRVFQESSLQLAHRICKSKAAKKYIMNVYEVDKKQLDSIINHKYNLAVSCADCNDSFNIFNNPVKTDKLLDKIMGELKNEI